ncbi:MAG TPA: hypothetical protein VNH46_12890, partial [Gemmatimonadales bacterium]|nr:hypothetical protein [Gemmatimonadales bacterium]
MLTLLLALAGLPPSPADTSAFADSATRSLVLRAIARHGAEDSTVRDYQAGFRYRLSFGLGRRRWARVPNASVEEQEGRIQWQRPNDLRVEILGRRARARSADLKLSSSFDRPWFVPRALPDSVRIFGNEIPRQPAVHPLAAAGPAWYRYRLVDSVHVSMPDGRRLRLLAVEVRPARAGISLVAGRIWLDAATADLVRFTFRFVGTQLWVDPDERDRSDSAHARRLNRLINRVLTLDADLEYALQDERYWMPYRQVVSGRVELPWFGELVVPFEATTTFEDYHINTGRPIAFTLPLPPDVTDPDSIHALVGAWRDSVRRERRHNRKPANDRPARDRFGLWQGGHYEIHRAPRDSLAAYAAWGDSLTLSDDPAEDRAIRQVQTDLERMSASLPDDLTDRHRSGFAWERIAGAMRYNRVEGLAPRLAWEQTLSHDGFTTGLAEARFGFSDHRVVGGLTLTREAPGARWTLHAYRDLLSNDPLSRANRLGNSFNALFVGHDDADYHLAHGVHLERQGSLGPGLELRTSAWVERETSVRREASSWLNDALGGTGRFPLNPPVRDGTYGGAAVQLDGGAFRRRWTLAADFLGNADRGTARLWGRLGLPIGRGTRIPVLALH